MIISGLLSTVDSNLCAAASLMTDLFKYSKIKISRISMLVLLVLAIMIANIPSLTVTYLFLFYGTLRASTMFPTILTLSKVKLSSRGVIAGVIVALAIGLPIFAFGSLHDHSLYKTIGSLVTLFASGIIALAVAIREAAVCK